MTETHRMPRSTPQTEAVINLNAIAGNTSLLRSRTSAEVMAVVKADGYGHGLVPSAQAALAGGATWLGVCTIDEALTLRRAGITAPVLSWLNTPSADLLAPGGALEQAISADVDLSVADEGFLEQIVTAARRNGDTARVHLKVDTGLGRNGAPVRAWGSLCDAAAKAQAEEAVNVVGVWSHFAYADAPGHATIALQRENFDAALETAQRHSIRPEIRHLANSAASLTAPETHYDMIRPGIAVYGLCPMPEMQIESGLRPAMTLRGRVTLAKRVPAGHGVSYGHIYTTSEETMLALVPLGYADGIPRAASNSGPVQLGGKRRRIAGRVCMDQIMVDVGDDAVSPGDAAVLFGPGDDGEPTANDWAAQLDTISYEIVTRAGLGARVEKTYVGLDH